MSSGKRLIDAQNNQGKTPLHLAVEAKNLNMAETLLQYAPDQTLQDSQGHTPLQLAISTQQPKMVNLLSVGFRDLKRFKNVYEKEEKNAERSE